MTSLRHEKAAIVGCTVDEVLFYSLVNRFTGRFSCSEFKCFVTIAVKNKSVTFCEKFCRILHRLNFVVHWRSPTYHVTKVAMSRSKAWW